MGITLNYRGQSTSSDPLVPSQPVSDLMVLVAQRYELNDPTPAGLQVCLCFWPRCVELGGQGGTTNGFSNIPAIEPMYFTWEVPSGDRPIPVLRIQSNQVIVSCR